MSEEWKKEFIDTLSKRFEVDMKRYEISNYIWKSLFNMEQERNTYKERIDKAIEYIEKNRTPYEDYYNVGSITYDYDYEEDILLGILKGVDKE